MSQPEVLIPVVAPVKVKNAKSEAAQRWG
jgi:hypothetical protein